MQQPFPLQASKLIALVATVFALPAAHAQSITVEPLAATVPAAIPVDHPGALALLALAICVCIAWAVRTGHLSLGALRSWAAGGAVVVAAAMALWGDKVQAELQELQRYFTQPAGETLDVPVEPTALAANGAPLGFQPVTYQNQTPVVLRVRGITQPVWNVCFPLGVPSPLPTTAPRAGNACTDGTVLEADSACWVDVAALCAAAADTVRGSQPTVLAPDTALVTIGGQATGNVLANDADADGPLLVAAFVFEGITVKAGVSSTVGGRGRLLVQSDGSFSFQPDLNFAGSNPVVVAYTTQTGASSTLSITVNHPPVAVNDNTSTPAGTPVTIAVRANDTDADNDPLTVTAVTQGAHGVATVDGATGNPRYVSNTHFAGIDSFTYTVGDGRGGSATATVTVDVTNLPPTTVADAISVLQGGAASTLVGGATSVLANDTDPEAAPLTAVLVSGPANGSLFLNPNGTFFYIHNDSRTSTDSFAYYAFDGYNNGNTVTVGITVIPVNHRPVANDDRLPGAAVNSFVDIAFSTLLANDTDADGDTLTVISAQNTRNGSLSVVGGLLRFTADPEFEGVAGFDYTIRDSQNLTATASVHIPFGRATAPSLVVQKSLVAIAHGTGGTSVKFPIITRLVDTDGSETLSIKVSGVPTNLSFNDGTNLGGGVWQFTEADLPNLTLNLPGSYTTNATHLTVQVTSTEINGGFTASTSSVATLKAAYTTVDITTTESGNYTGSTASEYIQGGNGNNTINAANGNNIVRGGGGDDTLSSGSGSDILDGGSGNDILRSGSGTDVLIGGSGDDLLIGGDLGETFVDVFVWNLGDQGAAGDPAKDTIQNFATAAASTNGSGGDVLHLRELLQGESVGPANSAGNLANYLHFAVESGNTILYISHTGGFSADSHAVGGSYTSSAETQRITLEGVNLQTAYNGATADQQIITQLLNNNKLIVD